MAFQCTVCRDKSGRRDSLKRYLEIIHSTKETSQDINFKEPFWRCLLEKTLRSYDTLPELKDLLCGQGLEEFVKQLLKQYTDYMKLEQARRCAYVTKQLKTTEILYRAIKGMPKEECRQNVWYTRRFLIKQLILENEDITNKEYESRKNTVIVELSP